MVRQRWKSAGTGCCERCTLPLHRHEWVRLDPADVGDTALCPIEPPRAPGHRVVNSDARPRTRDALVEALRAAAPRLYAVRINALRVDVLDSLWRDVIASGSWADAVDGPIARFLADIGVAPRSVKSTCANLRDM